MGNIKAKNSVLPYTSAAVEFRNDIFWGHSIKNRSSQIRDSVGGNSHANPKDCESVMLENKTLSTQNERESSENPQSGEG